MEKAPNNDHYKSMEIEPIEYIVANGYAEGFCVGNIIKYVSRYKQKDGVKDLQKAKWYIDYLIGLEMSKHNGA